MQETRLTSGPLPQLIAKMAVPTALGFLFHNIFNATDQYFAGKIGTAAQGGVGTTFPLLIIMMALANGVANGITALAAHALGAGDREKARTYILQGNILALLLAVLLTAAGHYLCEPMLRTLGIQGQTFTYGVAFITTIYYGAIFFVACYTLNAGLNALGNTKPFRSYMMLAAFLNFIFNPIFLYGVGPLPGLGIYGIALSTICVQLIGSIYIASVLFSHSLLANFSFNELRPKLAVMLEVVKYGLPASVNMLTVAAGAFIYTFFINVYGEKAVAAYAISLRIEQIVLLPAIGLNVAALSIVGQNFGAQNYLRVRQCYSLCLKYGFIVCILGGLFLCLFKNKLLAFFTDDLEVIGFGELYILAAAATLFSYALIWISTSMLQGLKQPYFVIWISIYRQILAPLLVLSLASQYFGYQGIVWGFSALTASAAIFTYLYSQVVLRKLPLSDKLADVNPA